MSASKIEWTDATWNPVTGCSKISAGCVNCYAERMASRLKAMGQRNYRNGFEVTLHEHMLEYPLHWKKPRTIFVNSMSDMFHEDISDEFICRVFEVMQKAHWHKFQVLTKRAERLAGLEQKLAWPKNVWMGVTVEKDDYRHRIDLLRNTNAAIKFLSMEPLLSDVPRMNLTGIDWVIVGGESGPGARPMEQTWVESIQSQCEDKNTPFFFKQWGGVNKKKAGRLLHGKTYNERPAAAFAA
ncbi:MAG: phage Gp37/Gp68 family protein [Deltaproteobacteria bacterium]|nr:phage Gp37/Gp68 family protein [Deltaproteobacteria bacterium]